MKGKHETFYCEVVEMRVRRHLRKPAFSLHRSDCVSLLNKCADKERMFPNANVEEMCDLFSPPDLQSNCITLSAYTSKQMLRGFALLIECRVECRVALASLVGIQI